MRIAWSAAVLAMALGACGGTARREVSVLDLLRTQPPAAPAPQEPVTAAAAVEIALANYPAVRAARARAEAAQAGIDLVDTAYLPRVDLLWQAIRATRNNISGTALPQGVVPGISGPVLPGRSWKSAWGISAGVLVSYEPFDFGLRAASVEIARLVARQAEADVQVTRLETASGAAEAFLAHAAAEQALKAAQANGDRWDVFARSVRALVERELRPGVDASRADAELAAARIQLIQARQLVETSRAALAEALGLADASLKTDPGPLLELPQGAEVPAGDPLGHPLLSRQALGVEGALARQDALDRAWYPRVNLQLSLNDRGSGFGSDGKTLDPEDGLYPDRANWAAGVTLALPAMDLFSLNARRRAEEGFERAERARTDQVFLSLRMQNLRVRSAFEAARQVAENTPVQLKAAQEAHQRARARYDTGLGTLTEVAEAQRLLAQSEIDDALARLSVWRALAAAGRVHGDMRLFLDAVARAAKK